MDEPTSTPPTADGASEPQAPVAGTVVQPTNPVLPSEPVEAAPAPVIESPTNPATTEPPSSTKSGFLGSLSAIFFVILNWIIIPVAIVFVLHNFVFQAFHVVGSSMIPTLHDADYLIVSKIGKTISGVGHKAYIPNRYQVVVFHYPKDPSLIFVKRVIGLPGEHVVVKDGQVRVYNQANPQGLNPDTQTYQRAADTTQGSFDDIVPADSIFVLGDNRTPSGSFDSRDWGFLPSSYIVGTASVRLLPLDQFRFFSVIQNDLMIAACAL